MSTFKHPVGPQSSRVYWRRRLVVLLGLIAVVVVIILIVARPGASSGEPASAPVATATHAPSAAASASASGSASPAASGSGASAASDAPSAASTNRPASGSTAAGENCNPSDVRVEAVTDKSSYAAGELPMLSIAITNTGSAPCKISAGTAEQVFTITSGSEVYWKSTDCQTGKSDAEVLLQPAKTISSQSPITWDRTRSDPATCGAKRTQVPAAGASYHLQVSVGGVQSSETKQFILR